jgi:Mannosyltransferase (PIG-M)
MPEERGDLLRGRGRLLLIAAAVAFLLKVALAARTYGTNDVQTFEEMLEKLERAGARTLYAEGTDVILDGRVLGAMQMNHPPLVLAMLRVWGGLRELTGLRLGFWLRFSCALADLITLGALYGLFGIEGDHWKSAMLVALAPASIVVSGFHGNTDPIMIAFVVLSVYLLEKRDAAWLAGVAFGLACSVKVWPLVLVPAVLLSGGGLARRARFGAAVLATFLLILLPWKGAGLDLILDRVFHYSSYPGWWGLTYLFPSSASALRTVVIAAMVGGAAYLHQRVPSLFAQWAILTFGFFFFAPGFGPQYLAWAVPWTVAAGWRSAAAFHAAAGAFLFGVYTGWSGGLPWDFANAHKYYIPVWASRIGVVAWAILAVLIVDAWRRNECPLVPKKAAPRSPSRA